MHTGLTSRTLSQTSEISSTRTYIYIYAIILFHSVWSNFSIFCIPMLTVPKPKQIYPMKNVKMHPYYFHGLSQKSDTLNKRNSPQIEKRNLSVPSCLFLFGEVQIVGGRLPGCHRIAIPSLSHTIRATGHCQGAGRQAHGASRDRKSVV